MAGEPESIGQSQDSKETGDCEKCQTEIHLDADRYPQCGYEPSKGGILLGIFVGLSVLNVFINGLIIALAWGAVVVTGYTATEALGSSAVFGFLMLPAIVILYYAGYKERQTPTGYTKSWSEALDTS